MITIEEIPVDRIDEFWKIHLDYLVKDGIIEDEEDIDYFASSECRDIIRSHMMRDRDVHHMVYFTDGDKRVGACQYVICHSEDGKCFILDFWVFEEYRGEGMGHRGVEARESYTKKDGALYYEINSEKEGSVRFWKSLGFIENGADEYGMALYIRR